MNLADIKDGISFENYVQQLFLSKNIPALTTPTTNDYGADLIVKYKDLSFAIQCKYYAHPVGVKAIQEVMASLNYYSADYGVVITNSMFTQQAINLANTNNVLLIDGSMPLANIVDYLESFIGKTGSTGVLERHENEEWTTEDLIIRYGVSKGTLLKNYLSYGLPYRKIGREYRFNRDEVVNWEIERRSVPFGRNHSRVLPGFEEFVNYKKEEYFKAKKAGDRNTARKIRKELKQYGYPVADIGLEVILGSIVLMISIIVIVFLFSTLFNR